VPWKQFFELGLKLVLFACILWPLICGLKTVDYVSYPGVDLRDPFLIHYFMHRHLLWFRAEKKFTPLTESRHRQIEIMDNPYTPPLPAAIARPDPGKYSTSAALSLGWKAYRENIGISTAIALIWIFLYMMAANSCFGIVVLPHLFAGWIIASVGVARNAPKVESLFGAFEFFGPVFAAGALFTLIFVVFLFMLSLVFVGGAFVVGFWSAILKTGDFDRVFSEKSMNSPFGLFFMSLMFFGVIAQFYLTARFQLVFPLMMERKLPVIEAFRESWSMTAPHLVQLTLVKLLTDFLLPVMGVLLGCIPLVFTLPFALAVQGALITLFMGDHQAEKQVSAVQPQNPATPPVEVPAFKPAPPRSPPEDRSSKVPHPYD